MSETCACCGKKLGLINGSHLNNKICDNCYFPIGGYLTDIENSTDINEIQKNYDQLIFKLQQSSYLEAGKQHIINYADETVKEHNSYIAKNEIKNNFPLTTSYNFEGYTITKYYGLSSGSTVLGTGIKAEYNAARSDWFGVESDAFSDKLEEAKQSAITKMIQSAIDKGGNAIIGVTFNYVCFSSNMIGVIANGTVVNIEEETINNESGKEE